MNVLTKIENGKRVLNLAEGILFDADRCIITVLQECNFKYSMTQDSVIANQEKIRTTIYKLTDECKIYVSFLFPLYKITSITLSIREDIYRYKKYNKVWYSNSNLMEWLTKIDTDSDLVNHILDTVRNNWRNK
jgi:hypothetical protein